MGLFSLIMKGVKVDQRPARSKRNSSENLDDQFTQLALTDVADLPIDFDPTAIELPPMPEVVPDLQAQPTQQSWEQINLEQARPSAASILFEGAMPIPATPSFNTVPPFTGALGGATLGNRSILVVTPRTNADVTGIVENLQNGEACIITLDGIPIGDAQRRLDFLSGVVCAIGGTIQPLDTAKYVLTPSGLGVKR